jgi:hypothetical protein
VSVRPAPGGLAGALVLWLLLLAPNAAAAALPAPERAVLDRYLSALAHADYRKAFALLSDDEQRYFQNPANFASVYAADRFKIDDYQIIGSKREPAGSFVIVSERFEYFDHAHQTPAAATAHVPYGIVAGKRGDLRVADRLHPWRAVAPADASATLGDVRVIVRKVSFFTGRVEVVATFQNLGEKVVTWLPYLRSVLRDDSGRTYRPLETSRPGLMDRTLFTGLRLVPGSQYTGAITFTTPDRFTPKHLSASFGPALLDGADEPFSLYLTAFSVGA